MHQLLLRIKSFSLKNLLYIMGVGSLAFILEACYGTPTNDFEEDLQPRAQTTVLDTSSVNITDKVAIDE